MKNALLLFLCAGLALVKCDCNDGSPVQILSDVDDTIFSGGSGTGNTDDTQPKHTFYDGILEFYLALSLGFGKNAVRASMEPLGPILLSARPFVTLVSKLRQVMELQRLNALSTFSTNNCMLGDNRVFPRGRARPSWDIQGVLLGRKGDLLNSAKTRNEKFGQTKFDNFENFAAGKDTTEAKRWFTFPGRNERARQDRCYVFVGDDGQGDEAAGVKMLSQFGPPEVRARGYENNPYLVKAVFIHNVSKLNKKTGGYFLNRDDPMCLEYGHVLEHMHYFDTVYGAAATAYDKNLIDIFGLGRVLSVPCRACQVLMNNAKKIKGKARVPVVRWCQMSGNDIERGLRAFSHSISIPPNIRVVPVSGNAQSLRGKLLRKVKIAGLFDESLFIEGNEESAGPIRALLGKNLGRGSLHRNEWLFIEAVRAMNNLSRAAMSISDVAETKHQCDGVDWIIEAMQILVSHDPRMFTRAQLLKIWNGAQDCAKMFTRGMSIIEYHVADGCVAQLISEGIYTPYRDYLNLHEIPNGPERYQLLRKSEATKSPLYQFAMNLDIEREEYQNTVMQILKEESSLWLKLSDLQAVPAEIQAEMCLANMGKRIDYPDDVSEISDILSDDYSDFSDDDYDNYQHSWVNEDGSASRSKEEDETSSFSDGSEEYQGPSYGSDEEY